MRWLILCLVVGSLSSASPLASGSVQGSVSDATGARVPGATVRVINPISSHERDAITDAKGEFRILDVPPNSYHLSVEKDGFRVVATLASAAEELSIRFVSTLGPGQRLVISVPRSVDQSPVDFEIERKGQAVLVTDPAISPIASMAD